MDSFACPICKRDVPDKNIEKHHLNPKCKKGKEVIYVCCSCGDMLHQLFSVQQLSKQYNTLEKINNNVDVKRWAEWVGKKTNDFSICMSRKKKR